jgi:hypothetical protein
MALDINDPDQLAPLNLDGMPGLRGDRDHPGCGP